MSSKEQCTIGFFATALTILSWDPHWFCGFMIGFLRHASEAESLPICHPHLNRNRTYQHLFTSGLSTNCKIEFPFVLWFVCHIQRNEITWELHQIKCTGHLILLASNFLWSEFLKFINVLFLDYFFHSSDLFLQLTAYQLFCPRNVVYWFKRVILLPKTSIQDGGTWTRAEMAPYDLLGCDSS